jgi:alkylation response protein AidB-like acyl-CoA dehydrogenase
MTATLGAAPESQRMLAEAVATFVARHGGVARARRLRGSPGEHDPLAWRAMAEAGWLAILVPERYGGLGLGLSEMAVVARGLARALAPEPLIPVAVAAVTALAAGENEELKRAELPRIAAGERLAVLAWQEEPGAPEGQTYATRAVPCAEGLRLEGVKRFIGGAAQADAFIVCAHAQETEVLAWLPRHSPGARLELEPLADGRFFGTLRLEGAVVAREQLIAGAASARAALARAFDCACVGTAAELLGTMEGAFDLTLDYLKTRVQFGRPIGAFQALQHRTADLYVQKELAAAVLEQAAALLEREAAPERRAAAASRAKARCSEAALRIAREAIQLHGAIGFTDEHDAGLYLKRALVLAAWLGHAAWHRRRYARLAAPAHA